MDKRGWILGMAAALALALLSLLTSITSEAQLTGEADTLLTTRLSVNKLLNTGTAWAGLPILAGWMVRRPLGAAAIGVVSCLTALVTHYGLGQVVGIFEPEIWASNRYWFAFALVLGAPLGLVGSLAHRAGVLGLLARLTAPLGATLEPFVLQMFAQPDYISWPGRVSTAVCGALLVAGGVAGLVLVAMRERRRRAQSLRPVQK